MHYTIIVISIREFILNNWIFRLYVMITSNSATYYNLKNKSKYVFVFQHTYCQAKKKDHEYNA